MIQMTSKDPGATTGGTSVSQIAVDNARQRILVSRAVNGLGLQRFNADRFPAPRPCRIDKTSGAGADVEQPPTLDVPLQHSEALNHSPVGRLAARGVFAVDQVRRLRPHGRQSETLYQSTFATLVGARVHGQLHEAIDRFRFMQTTVAA
tara:strand:+ start:639 stop:1085 length:447 start_codon:yes stop_codon:yes gene_type:complete